MTLKDVLYLSIRFRRALNDQSGEINENVMISNKFKINSSNYSVDLHLRRNSTGKIMMKVKCL